MLRRGRAWAKQAAWLSLLSPRWTVPFTWCSGHRRSLGPSVQGPPGADRAPSRTTSLSMAPHVAPPHHLLQCRPLCLDWTDNVHTFFQNRVLPPPQYLISCSLSRGCDRTSLGTRPGGGGGSRWVSALRAPPGHPGPFSQGTCSWDGSPVAGAWNSGCWARWPLWPPGHLVGIPAVRPLSPSPRVKASPCSGSLPEARCPSHDPLAAICVLELGPDARWLARESGHRWARPGRVSEARRGERAHRGGFSAVPGRIGLSRAFPVLSCFSETGFTTQMAQAVSAVGAEPPKGERSGRELGPEEQKGGLLPPLPPRSWPLCPGHGCCHPLRAVHAPQGLD